MKITIKTSGGIGGFGLSPTPTTADVQALSRELQKRVRSAFAGTRLKSLAKASGNPNAADTIAYEIIVTEDNGQTKRVELSEDKLPADMLDLIDQIRSAGN